MSIPRNVERQLAEAEALNAAAQAAAAQAAAGQPTVITDASQLLSQPPAPPQDPSPPPPPAPTPPTPPAPPPVDWEQKFKTLQGKYNAELPALRNEVQQLRRAQAPAPTPPAPTPAPKPTMDPKDIESFGAEMIEMVGRYAQQVAQQLNDKFEARIVAIEERINGVGQKAEVAREQAFFAVLAELVPDWEQVNIDDRWLAWLAEVDSFSGIVRQELLNNAQHNADARRAAAIFNAFKAQFAAPAPVSPPPAQLQPSTSGGSNQAPALEPPKPILTQAFVNKFYMDRDVHHRYRGREAEAQRIELEINLAAREGRIR